MDQGVVDSPVTLVIKAPNQKYDDQTINCYQNWTVEKLKAHLSDVYPSKPVSLIAATDYFYVSLTHPVILCQPCQLITFVQSQGVTFSMLYWEISFFLLFFLFKNIKINNWSQKNFYFP